MSLVCGVGDFSPLLVKKILLLSSDAVCVQQLVIFSKQSWDSPSINTHGTFGASS